MTLQLGHDAGGRPRGSRKASLSLLSLSSHHRPVLLRDRALAKAIKMPKTFFVHNIVTLSIVKFINIPPKWLFFKIKVQQDVRLASKGGDN